MKIQNMMEKLKNQSWPSTFKSCCEIALDEVYNDFDLALDKACPPNPNDSIVEE